MLANNDMSNPWSNLTGPLLLTREFVSLLPDDTLVHQLPVHPSDHLTSPPDVRRLLVRTYAAWDVTMIGPGNRSEPADKELGEEMTPTEINSCSDRGVDTVNPDTVPGRDEQHADIIISDSDYSNYMFDSDVDASAYFVELFKDLDMQDCATGVTAPSSACVGENIIETVNTLFSTTPPCARRIRANSLNFPPPPPIRRIRRIGSVPLGDYECNVFEPCLHHEDLFAAFAPAPVSDGMDSVKFHV
ncbi:hypothetical protein NP233_g2411 [Leucocoprinus birnbaumii]|uniref:Uncharacterized protein n=1 Tax=Leucocoprinus birnbaumii TaxID=56174 RepID=A0AAD5W0T5_9AGAR|nr:hypothetical protein NP233_g2411 [Leucocoprinus birnbaumii]